MSGNGPLWLKILAAFLKGRVTFNLLVAVLMNQLKVPYPPPQVGLNWVIVKYELYSKLLTFLLITPIILPHIHPYVNHFKDFRL